MCFLQVLAANCHETEAIISKVVDTPFIAGAGAQRRRRSDAMHPDGDVEAPLRASNGKPLDVRARPPPRGSRDHPRVVEREANERLIEGAVTRIRPNETNAALTGGRGSDLDSKVRPESDEISPVCLPHVDGGARLVCRL